MYRTVAGRRAAVVPDHGVHHNKVTHGAGPDGAVPCLAPPNRGRRTPASSGRDTSGHQHWLITRVGRGRPGLPWVLTRCLSANAPDPGDAPPRAGRDGGSAWVFVDLPDRGLPGGVSCWRGNRRGRARCPRQAARLRARGGAPPTRSPRRGTRGARTPDAPPKPP